MLTLGVQRGSLAALAVMLLALVALTGGTAMVQAQAQTLDGNTATLTPGQGASPQEELLAEALGALVEAGYNPADFDFENAVFDPRGRAIIIPIKDLQTRLREKELPILIGVLYVRESLTIADLKALLRVNPRKFKFIARVDHVYPGLYPIELRGKNAQTGKPRDPSGERITLYDSVTSCLGVSAGLTWKHCTTVNLDDGSSTSTWCVGISAGVVAEACYTRDGDHGDPSGQQDDSEAGEPGDYHCPADPTEPECVAV